MLKHSRIEVKYYSQYRSHDLFEFQESLSGLSKSNRWVKLADHFPWDRIERDKDIYTISLNIIINMFHNLLINSYLMT